MVRLTRAERQTLQGLLLGMLNIDDSATRNLLLTDLPPALQRTVSRSSSTTIDVANIINAADAWELPEGEDPPIYLVIENAVSQVSGTKTANDLQKLLDELRQRAGGGSPSAPGSSAQAKVAGGAPSGAQNTGLGTQWNVGSQSANRDIYQGNTINNYYGTGSPSSSPPAASGPPAASSGGAPGGGFSAASSTRLPDALRLSGPQRRDLLNALVAAFPTISDLRQMVSFELGQNLEQIAGLRDLNSTVFDLLTWAEARGQTAALIQGAVNTNPGNPELRRFVQQITAS